MKRIFILAGLISSNLYAKGNWRLIAPNDIHIDAYKSETVHDPYLDPIDSELGYGAGFNLDLDIAKYNGLGLYWNNLLHFDQSSQSGQIKHGGWQYEIGAVIWQENGLDRVQLFKQHHSRHIFEETRNVHFPVYDRYGFRLRVYP
jgi:hypothetical protein